MRYVEVVSEDVETTTIERRIDVTGWSPSGVKALVAKLTRESEDGLRRPSPGGGA